jgi:hypothetical protein
VERADQRVRGCFLIRWRGATPQPLRAAAEPAVSDRASSDFNECRKDVSCDDSAELRTVRQALRERVPIEDLGHRKAIHGRLVIGAEVELEGLDQLRVRVAQGCGQVRKR